MRKVGQQFSLNHAHKVGVLNEKWCKKKDEPKTTNINHITEATNKLKDCPQIVGFINFINETHLSYITKIFNNILKSGNELQIFEMNKEKKLDEYYNSYNKILKETLYTICDATVSEPGKYTFGNNFNEGLIGKTFIYLHGLYSTNIKESIPEIITKVRYKDKPAIDINKDLFDYNEKFFTLTNYTDYEIEFTIDDGTKVTFKKTLSERDYPGNSIYGHIFEQIEDEPTDAKSQPSEEPKSGGKRTRRKNRRRRHQKSRKNRKSRRRI